MLKVGDRVQVEFISVWEVPSNADEIIGSIGTVRSINRGIEYGINVELDNEELDTLLFSESELKLLDKEEDIRRLVGELLKVGYSSKEIIKVVREMEDSQ